MVARRVTLMAEASSREEEEEILLRTAARGVLMKSLTVLLKLRMF
jgi:hypothetical protein